MGLVTAARSGAISRKDAGNVLLKRDVWFFGGACGIGIEGLEKIVDLLLHLFDMHLFDLPVSDLDLPAGWRDGLAWLDLVVHFRLHSLSSPEQLWLHFQAATHIWCHKPMGGG